MKVKDGPVSSRFTPLAIRGNAGFTNLKKTVSQGMAEAAVHAETGKCVMMGMPFNISKPLLIKDKNISRSFKPVACGWIVFCHTADWEGIQREKNGFEKSPKRGLGLLNKHMADYVILYSDGSEHRTEIRRRHQVGAYHVIWGENCTEAIPPHKPQRINPLQELSFGQSQYRVHNILNHHFRNWLYALENPFPGKKITGLRFEPVDGTILLSAVTAGKVATNPLRWETRKKVLLHMPKGKKFPTQEVDELGQTRHVSIDLGQVIHVETKPVYPKSGWNKGYNNKTPDRDDSRILIEYTAHPEACFHLYNGRSVPVSKVESGGMKKPMVRIPPAEQNVCIRVVDEHDRKVAVKLHIHGDYGEYLAPVDRHRVPNGAWFEDYSVDFINQGMHRCTYIDGETKVKLPLGKVYVEISKGFEIKPVRKILTVTKKTRTFTVKLKKILPWRETGWVSADTHVHFLSPQSALLEGAGEGVNVVNLLASQWGELMTNVGDFDGRTTHHFEDGGRKKEYMVRVGTENRQHVMGHISLLGYNGSIIAPMTVGGPDESALGDSVEILLTEWARQCRRQNGVVVIPHFPNPRLEHAATIVSGDADAVEMTSWGNLYGGLDPYSVSDWYRYLNNGYFVAAVGGTDKMSANTAVGTVRTYAQLDSSVPFSYNSWKRAVRRGNTFVTYGPLLDFRVDGENPGSKIKMSRTGGTVDISWRAASVTVPMSKVELIVNGEVREQKSIRGKKDVSGSWRLSVDSSSWAALLVRGHYPDKPEIIAAHSSPLMIEVEDSPFFAAADAMTILEQIEGALAYVDTAATRADAKTYKRVRMVLQGVHRSLHNRLHAAGVFHDHTSVMEHHGGK